MNTKKNELVEVQETDRNLSGLVELVNSSVEHYKSQSPKYQSLSETLLESLSSQDMLDVMDIDTKIKLLTLAQKNMIAPIESLTKLVQSMAALKERMELTTQKEDLEELINEVKTARDKANVHKIETLEVS